jgi:hypothetical protein
MCTQGGERDWWHTVIVGVYISTDRSVNGTTRGTIPGPVEVDAPNRNIDTAPRYAATVGRAVEWATMLSVVGIWLH